jgi:hypothetical protein
MRVLLILAAMSFSAAAFAQSTPPKIGDKPLVQMKPREPTGCKLVLMALLSFRGIPEPTGSRRATPLLLFQHLTGHPRVGSELRDAISATETRSLSERATAVIPPGQKQ